MLFSIHPPPLIIPPRPAIVRANTLAGIPSWADMQRRIKRAERSNFQFVPFGAVGTAGVALTYEGFKADDSNLTNYSYTSCPVGTGSRKIVVCILGATGASATVSSVTVDGNAMTAAVAAANGASEYTRHYYYDATGSTGSSVTIAVNWSAAVAGCHITIYTMTGAAAGGPSSTVSANYSSTTAALTSNCPANGAIIGSVMARDDTVGYTWTNLTENYDVGVDGAPNGQPGSSASAMFAAQQTSLAITAVLGGSIIRGIYGVTTSWGP